MYYIVDGFVDSCVDCNNDADRNYTSVVMDLQLMLDDSVEYMSYTFYMALLADVRAASLTKTLLSPPKTRCLS